MDLPLERNRAANKDGPLLIGGTVTYLSGESQIIYDLFPLEIPVEGSCQKVLCASPKGLSASLQAFNFPLINWKELSQKCSE
jgi:hypothetical protein